MLRLLKMDLYRLFHRKILYVMVIALSAMTLSMLFLADPSTMSVPAVLGVMNGISMDNFMSAGSGLGLVYTLMCIMLSFLICDDFSSGFAKNIFTVHSNKFDYIVSKIISMMAASAVLMVISLAESFIYCKIAGIATGSFGGIFVFWIEKWILSAPFAASILFLSLWFRNKGLGFLFACLAGTGGLVMGVVWAFEALHFPYANEVLSWTVYGASTVPSLTFHMMDMIHILVAAAIWVCFYSVLSNFVLNRKDI